MPVRQIVQIGHPVLRQVARRLAAEELASAEIQGLIDDLIETMHAANGAGLAANQVGEAVAVCVVHVADNPRYPHKPRIPLTVLVNPVVTPQSEKTFDNYEGCLSVPDLRGVVRRFGEVRVTGLTREGAPFDKEFRGFSAGTMQHETDHLNGRLFVDSVQDPATLTTWAGFSEHHEAGFSKTIDDVLRRYHAEGA
jgi:peptide deformylase